MNKDSKEKLSVVFPKNIEYVDVQETYDYSERRDASSNPPGGLKPEEVPMFLTLGWDDNGCSGLPGSKGGGGMKWAMELFSSRKNPAGAGNPSTFDGTTPYSTFYYSTIYMTDPEWTETRGLNKKICFQARLDGHENGNHTQTHNHATEIDIMTVNQWTSEMDQCRDVIEKPHNPEESAEGDNNFGIGVMKREVSGFRSPYLRYNNNAFTAMKEFGFIYDCSIPEGMQDDQDGTNFHWPYTLDNGSTGHDARKVLDPTIDELKSHTGLWEMPVYSLIIPDDENCEKYGIPKGLRERVAGPYTFTNLAEKGKVLGLDWDLFVECETTKEEALGVLKYNFDLRYNGNRCPFLFGVHSDCYADKTPGWNAKNMTVREKQEVIEAFLDYAMSKEDTRLVSMKQALDWVRNPVALKDTENSWYNGPEMTVAPGNKAVLMDMAGEIVKEYTITGNSLKIEEDLKDKTYILKVEGHNTDYRVVIAN